MGETMRAVASQLSVPLPEGWFHKESITILAPDGQANVIVSSEPLDPTLDSAAYAQLQGELLTREFPWLSEMSFGPISWLGGKRAFLRHFTWTPQDGVPVTQMQAYYAGAGRGFTATATTPRPNFSRVEVLLRDVLLGVVLASPQGQRRGLLGGISSRASGQRS
ncbi:DUF1795 domain-containing protein [Ornithinimicrobium ciconiae]|uniref:DUF1795 domain-containing protein n=2 Tax=Ornithinimicrobium ciconiae TaxID=2594265 RepID=A0A516G7A8_9MICO|nr:DUF1795 domain-containing protein [Ornithinimicrobium ciconiae]